MARHADSRLAAKVQLDNSAGFTFYDFWPLVVVVVVVVVNRPV